MDNGTPVKESGSILINACDFMSEVFRGGLYMALTNKAQ